MKQENRERRFFMIRKSLICIVTVVCTMLTVIYGFGLTADVGGNGVCHAFSLYSDTVGEEAAHPATLEELRLSDVSVIAALPNYDSREYGLVMPVRDQKDSDLCWAYASVAASETSILRSGITPVAASDLSLSPEALGYARYNRPADPLGNTGAVIDPNGADWYNSAGDVQYSASLMSQWCGPISGAQPANIDPFENAPFHLDNAIHINSKSVSDIKLAIAEYGAVTFSYNNVRETEYYNPKTESSSASYPHACTLIGWDDNIPAENFKPGGASQNGGWLVKNSYTSLAYFWLSYDNTCDSVYAFDFTAKQVYDNNYFYDNGLSDSLNYSINAKKACEIFESKKGSAEKTEYLKAVNIGFIGKNVTAKVDIYVDLADESNPETGTKAGGGQASFKYGGFRTVNLDTPVALENGKKFACVVSVVNPENSAVIRNMLGKNGTPSFIYKNYWQSANNCTPRIKAFTSSVRNDEPLPHIHTLVSNSGKAATCTDDGVLAHDHCTSCNKDFVGGVEKTAEELKISALGHNIIRHEANAATCTQNGHAAYDSCSRCEYTTYTELPALGHDYGEWTVVKQPTIDEYGEERRICSRDGTHTETRQLPKLDPPYVEPDDGSGGVPDDTSGTDSDIAPVEKNFNALWLIPAITGATVVVGTVVFAVCKKTRKNKSTKK